MYLKHNVNNKTTVYSYELIKVYDNITECGFMFLSTYISPKTVDIYCR